jgi:UDP-N-acetylmuramoylalanine--D-glutamate ligase
VGEGWAGSPAAVARHAPNVPVELPSSMDHAGEAASVVGRLGATVALAPAAASTDTFRDYAERGGRFAVAARARGG